MELRQVARDAYACLQEDRGFGWSNSGFVNRGGGLVVDTFFDVPHTRRMIDLYASVAPEPARRLVNTHHNGDHCWGNQLFREAEIIGHRRCAEAMQRDLKPADFHALLTSDNLPPALKSFAEDARAFDFSSIELTPPNHLIEDRFDIDLDGLAAEILYVGPAHTAGDVIVHLPERRVVYTGDILFRLCTPIGWEGTTSHWIAALDRIEALAPEVVVPGHGPVCGVDGVREMRAYLHYVRSEARRGFEAELSVLEAAKAIDLGPYAGWTQPERLVFNVERAYREFRGDPWDTPVDALRVLGEMQELGAHLRSH